MRRFPILRLWPATLPILLMSLWALSCGDPPAPPCASYCAGCCTVEGVCFGTASQSAGSCGLRGEVCSACGPSQSCQAGVCQGGTTDGGTNPDAGTTCGTEGAACCTQGTVCDRGLACIGGTCSAPICGAAGQACCPGSSCNSPLACVSGTCEAPAACGAQGQVCCGGTTACNGTLECRSGSCQTPGGGGNPGNLPVGSACTGGADCVTGTCRVGNFTGGYCSKSCSTQGDCPSGSTCASDPFNSLNKVCLDACPGIGSQSDCRTGYVCERSEHRPTDPGVCTPRCQAGGGTCSGGTVCNATTGLCAGKDGFGCLPGGVCGSDGSTCGADGYCRAASAYGGACTTNGQCPDGVCISPSATWPQGYCSGPCKADSERCAEPGGGCSYLGLPNNPGKNACLRECTFNGGQSDCRSGFVCDVSWTDKAQQTVCAPACTGNASCTGLDAAARCVSGFCCGTLGLTCCQSGVACAQGTCNSKGLCQ